MKKAVIKAVVASVLNAHARAAARGKTAASQGSQSSPRRGTLLGGAAGGGVGGARTVASLDEMRFSDERLHAAEAADRWTGDVAELGGKPLSLVYLSPCYRDIHLGSLGSVYAPAAAIARGMC